MLKFINKKRNRKGFTLVELIVVIAILGILAALAVPKLLSSRENAKNTAHEANIKTLRSAATIALAENGEPGDEITWNKSNHTSWPDTEPEDWNPKKYVEEWPTDPMTDGDYTVTISGGGVITVSPDTATE